MDNVPVTTHMVIGKGFRTPSIKQKQPPPKNTLNACTTRLAITSRIFATLSDGLVKAQPLPYLVSMVYLVKHEVRTYMRLQF